MSRCPGCDNCDPNSARHETPTPRPTEDLSNAAELADYVHRKQASRKRPTDGRRAELAASMRESAAGNAVWYPNMKEQAEIAALLETPDTFEGKTAQEWAEMALPPCWHVMLGADDFETVNAWLAYGAAECERLRGELDRCREFAHDMTELTGESGIRELVSQQRAEAAEKECERLRGVFEKRLAAECRAAEGWHATERRAEAAEAALATERAMRADAEVEVESLQDKAKLLREQLATERDTLDSVSYEKECVEQECTKLREQLAVSEAAQDTVSGLVHSSGSSVLRLKSKLAAAQRQKEDAYVLLEQYDERVSKAKAVLTRTGVPEWEPYPDDPKATEWEKSLRTGGRMIPLHERIEQLAAAQRGHVVEVRKSDVYQRLYINDHYIEGWNPDVELEGRALARLRAALGSPPPVKEHVVEVYEIHDNTYALCINRSEVCFFDKELNPVDEVADLTRAALNAPAAKSDDDGTGLLHDRVHVETGKLIVRKAIKVPESGPDAGYRTCQFCGCYTNAKMRGCCKAGNDEDRTPHQSRKHHHAVDCDGLCGWADCPSAPKPAPARGYLLQLGDEFCGRDYVSWRKREDAAYYAFPDKDAARKFRSFREDEWRRARIVRAAAPKYWVVRTTEPTFQCPVYLNTSQHVSPCWYGIRKKGTKFHTYAEAKVAAGGEGRVVAVYAKVKP